MAFSLMPSPSADPKFVLSILKFLSLLNFFQDTQNVLSILKWSNLCSKISLLSIPKLFWVYFKKLSMLKNLSILKTNFGSADGLGIRFECAKQSKNLEWYLVSISCTWNTCLWRKWMQQRHRDRDCRPF